MSSVQSTPLKKKNSILSKIKTFFNDIPDQQIAIVNEASFKRPPQIKKCVSADQGKNKIRENDLKQAYHDELLEELHEFNHVQLGE